MRNNLIRVMTQEFYGNRVETKIEKDLIDWFILGWVGEEGAKNGKRLGDDEFLAREEINIPNTDYVMIYNPKMEEFRIDDIKSGLEKDYILGYIPEKGINIYSKCLICRRGKDGELESLVGDDFEKVKAYLAE